MARAVGRGEVEHGQGDQCGEGAEQRVVLQYFNFLRLGRAGYEQIVANVMANAWALADRLGAIDGLELLTDASTFPIVALRTPPGEAAAIDLVELSRRLRERGWIVPAYTLPSDAEHITVLRMVVKENFSRDMVDMLAHDVICAVHALTRGQGTPRQRRRHRPVC